MAREESFLVGRTPTLCEVTRPQSSRLGHVGFAEDRTREDEWGQSRAVMESGQTIAGKYRLNQLLGTGGMATVWSATNVFTERQFAIKFMLPSVAKTEEAGRRFLLEAKVSARIDHPNIIEVIDVGQTEEGSLFLVMELLTGVSLETALRRQSPRMTLHEFSFVMVQVARALSAAHKSGVVHRDLKPSNIFLHESRDGAAVPKLLDFGVSKFLEEEGATNHALTIAGTVLGSPLYMSPEQARGEDGIDGRTDVFAFGAIMFEAFSGTRAYDAANFNALIVTIATTQPRKIDEFAPDVPESLRAIVRDCLLTDRTERAGTFDEISERLTAALPAIEGLEVRLPVPTHTMHDEDPEATNALPVVRPSDRPPSLSGGRSSRPPPNGEWGTPPGSTTAAITTVRSPPRGITTVMGGALVAGALFVAIVGVGIVRARRGPQVVAAPPNAPTIELTTPPIASSNPSAEPADPSAPPVINVDSLPVAKGTAKLLGKLAITAAPGACVVSIDNVAHGSTPTSEFDLTPGPHVVRCQLSTGKLKTMTLNVDTGAITRFKFATDN
jgi:serine/threonine protein kinase